MANTTRNIVVTRLWPKKDATGAAVRSQAGVQVNVLVTTLASQDRFFGLAGSPQFHWPVPKGAARASTLRTFLQPTPLNLIGKDAFFGLAGHPNFDWPNPRGSRRASDLRFYSRNTPIFLRNPGSAQGYLLI